MIPGNPYILIVEDYVVFREQLAGFLRGRGCLVDGVDSGEELDIAFKKKVPDILVLDLNLPGEDGLSIARRVRARSPSTGIVMLTARVTSLEKIEGYQSGADVYITKPAKPEEIFLAISNLASRLKPRSSEQTGHWALISKECKLVTPEQVEIDLTMNEYLVMETLILAPEGRATTDFLQEKLGKSSENFTKNQLEALISRLRKKLIVVAEDQPTIKAVWGLGYQLTINCQIR